MNGRARLAAALAAFRERDAPDTRREILAALVGSELVFPAAERGPDDRGIRLGFTNDGEGRSVLPGFTNEAHLRAWLRVGGASAKASAVDFIPAIVSGPFAGLVLDPDSDASAFIDRRALERLMTGQDSQSATVAANGDSLVKSWKSTAGT